jgi:hypothetical protein
MLEIFKVILQYKEAGVALFFAVLFYMDFRKKITPLDNTISNKLSDALDNNTKATKDSSDNSKKVEIAVNELNVKICELVNKEEIKKL